MERYPKIPQPLDARFASWLVTSTAATVGYHLSCGLSLPDREQSPHGRGTGWQGRASAAVLRECYRRRLYNAALEEVEVVALSVLPAPEPDEDALRPPSMLGPRERWEKAVGATSKAVHGVLRHGPASGTAGCEVLFSGGTLRAVVWGLELEQRVDSVWRRPDGALEAVLVFDEPHERGGPRPAADDWRCVLAAAVVRSLYGENPDVHAVWVCSEAARVSHIADETLDERLDRLGRSLEEALGFGGLAETGEDVFYRLSERYEATPAYGPAAGRRPAGPGRRGEY